jgi:hypothetical protein
MRTRTLRTTSKRTARNLMPYSLTTPKTTWASRNIQFTVSYKASPKTIPKLSNSRKDTPKSRPKTPTASRTYIPTFSIWTVPPPTLPYAIATRTVCLARTGTTMTKEPELAVELTNKAQAIRQTSTTASTASPIPTTSVTVTASLKDYQDNSPPAPHPRQPQLPPTPQRTTTPSCLSRTRSAHLSHALR